MKSKTRLIAVLLAFIIVLACAPFALAANGATVTVQHGETKKFELYRMTKDNWGAPDMSKRYSDFTAVITGDENIAKIVEQHGMLQIVGKTIGSTTYEATAADGETFTGVVSVIDSAPPGGSSAIAGMYNGKNMGAGWSGQGGWGSDSWIAATGGGYKYRVDYFVAEPQAVLGHIITPESEDEPAKRTETVTTAKFSESYGRLSLRYRNGAAHDVTLSAEGNIRIDENGYFYKDGEGASLRPGYATIVWGGTITMESPTLGTSTIDVYFE